jgi:hypothetical protein
VGQQRREGGSEPAVEPALQLALVDQCAGMGEDPGRRRLTAHHVHHQRAVDAAHLLDRTVREGEQLARPG